MQEYGNRERRICQDSQYTVPPTKFRARPTHLYNTYYHVGKLLEPRPTAKFHCMVRTAGF